MKRIIYLLWPILLSDLANAQHFLALPKTASPASESFMKKSGELADSAYFSNWQNGKWEMQAVVQFEYDAQDRRSKVYEKDPVSRQLKNEATYTYHSNGKIERVYTEAWVNGGKQPLQEELSRYDQNGNRTSYLIQQYNASQQSWTILYGDSFEFNYGINKRIEDYVLYQQTQGGLIPYQKLIWSDFDANDIPHTLVVQNHQQGNFENFLKLENLQWADGYDYANFDPSVYFGYSWSVAYWNPAVYDTSIYVDNQRIQKILINWNGVLLDTVSRVDYRYDAEGHRIETITYEKIGSLWSLSDGRRDSIRYTDTKSILERYYSYFDLNTSNWANQAKEEYFYPPGNTSSVKAIQVLHFYPNPASQSITLNFEASAVTAIALDGKRIQLQNLNALGWDVSSLKPGVYLVQAADGQSQRVARLQIR